MKPCAMCPATATHYCSQDDAFLCPACNVTIHSANVLASRHKVVCLADFCEEAAGAASPAALSQASASPAMMQVEQLAEPNTEALNSSEGVVPSAEADALHSAPEVPGVDAGFDAGLFGDDGLDLSAGWLDKLDGPLDFTGVFGDDDAGLVPGSSNEAARVPECAPSGSMDAEEPSLAPAYQEESAQDDFVLNMKTEELDWLVPNSAMDFSFTVPQQEQQQEQAPEHELAVVARDMPVVKPCNAAVSYQMPAPIVRISPAEAAINRAERLALYREKRKNRKFQKTIRYASRKAYAEVRPRIKGRFATPAEVAQMKAEAAAKMLAEQEQDMVVPCC